jgi:hypothetical protein
VRRVFRNIVLLGLIAVAPFSWADRCDVSLIALGSSFEQEPVIREVLLKELSSLYLKALQDSTLMPAFQMRLRAMASIESQPEADLYKEIEARADSPRGQKEIREVREERKREEHAQLYLGLEPYLSAIGEADRKAIEDQLIRPGLVNPLSTGEVEFKFQGKHQFIVGHEDVYVGRAGKTKKVSFGPDDGFAIGQVPVTQFMYFLVALGEEGVDATPSEFKKGQGGVVLRLGDRKYHLKPNHPVEKVSALDADAHARRVSEKTGVRYGLPTETRWEFANRAGNTGKYHFGDDAYLLNLYGWFEENSGNQTHAIGQLLSNDFHLYDTHGNVWEWTTSGGGLKNRVVRGGGWHDGAWHLRSAYRSMTGPSNFGYDLGFRLERQSPGNTPPAYTFTFGEPRPEAKLGSLNALRSLYQRLFNRLPGLGRSKK